MNFLGLHILTHNPSATIIREDGEIYSIALERVNRIKNSTNLYSDKLIEYLLDASELKINEIDKVAIDKVVKFETKKDFLKRTNFKFNEKNIYSINHHLAHAYSTFFSSGFEDCAALTIDGAGEWLKYNDVEGIEGTSIYNVENSLFNLVSKTIHPRNKLKGYTKGLSLGKFYSQISKMVGFDKYQEGKLMGLAPYGHNLDIKIDFSKYINFNNETGEIYINPNIFYNDRVIKLKKFIKNIFKNKGYFEDIYLPIKTSNKDWKNIKPIYIETAYIAQKVLENALQILGQWIIKKTKKNNLCVAGGVGLNIDANTILANDIGFKKTFTFPASEDSGISLGCAYWLKKKYNKNFKSKKIKNAYFGKKYNDTEILNALKMKNLKFQKENDIYKKVSKFLSDGKVIGWFSGRSEYGPRSLGNRSILADPRKENMRDYINKEIKKRELFRPFAPVVLEEKSNDYFDQIGESPFMLLKTNVKKNAKQIIPAVVHTDGSSRYQTVNKEQNQHLYNLIYEFGKMTNVFVLLNTSFNGPGEPIVESPEDACDSFKKLGLDYLIIENYIITK